MSDDESRDYGSETVKQLREHFLQYLGEREIRKGSVSTAGAIWDGFVAFACERVTHRGAPVGHEFIQVEVAGEAFSLSRIITLEDDGEDYEGAAECFIEFEVPGASSLDADLQGATLSGPAGNMHPHGDGDDHEYQTLEELDHIVRTRVLGSTFSSPATITAIDASAG